MLKPLPRRFYDRDTAEVARALLGKRLVRDTDTGRLAGRIVEVEAYLAQDDPANHGHRGQTRRNASMFGPPGRAYVYAIHSRWCLNAVTEQAGVASAVLIRAIEPLEGIATMQELRGIDVLRDLTRGPGRLCEALAIDRALDTCNLTRRGPLWIADDGTAPAPEQILATTRVGISLAADLPLRFYLADCPYVSKLPRRRTAQAR